MMLERIQDEEEAVVVEVAQSCKTKKKPNPLNTIQMQKLVSKKLHFSSAKTMEVAEKLYNKGMLSYPRTETDKFPPTMNM